MLTSAINYGQCVCACVCVLAVALKNKIKTRKKTDRARKMYSSSVGPGDGGPSHRVRSAVVRGAVKLLTKEKEGKILRQKKPS